MFPLLQSLTSTAFGSAGQSCWTADERVSHAYGVPRNRGYECNVCDGDGAKPAHHRTGAEAGHHHYLDDVGGRCSRARSHQPGNHAAAHLQAVPAWFPRGARRPGARAGRTGSDGTDEERGVDHHRVFLALLGTWLFGQPALGIDNATATLAALGLFLLTGVLRWEDVTSHREAWNTFVWFATLLMMATFLGELGITAWFTRQVSTVIGHTGWVAGFLALSLIYFYSHYFFASVTAHVSAMYAPFLAVALALGTPPLLAALVLGFFSALFSSLTHYGIAPAPIFFGTGYVSLELWWKVGAILAGVNIVIWLGLGGLWWKLLGYW